MASLAQHTAARNDNDLYVRLVAAAEQLGIDNAQMWVETNRGKLVAVDLSAGDGLDSSISDVHAYAVATYNPTPRPGENPAAVTDDQIKQAIQVVRGV